MIFLVIFLWALVAVYLLALIGIPLTVGKPRAPMTGEQAAAHMLTTVAVIVALALSAITIGGRL